VQPKKFGHWMAIEILWFPFDLGQIFLANSEIHLFVVVETALGRFNIF